MDLQRSEMTSQSASLSEILSPLDSESTPEAERKQAYAKFSRQFSTNDVSLFSLDVAKDVNHIINVILKDVGGNSAEVCQEALQVLGVILHDHDIVRNVTAAISTDVIKKLCTCIVKAMDKTVCTRSLWCLGVQNLTVAVIENQVEAILTAVDIAMEKWTGNSITVEHECVNTIARLAEQCPREMAHHAARWGKVLLPMVAHSAVKVRKRVLEVIESRLEMLLTNQREALAASLVPVFKSKVCSELKKLLAAKNELYVLKCWGYLVQIFGEELHSGTFTNTMLPIIELGFKSAVPEIKIAAFTAWQHLIDCFATNPSILGDQKRIKLVMQVFKINNARTEDVALVKFNVWWHFIWLLGNKVSTYFDMVAAPMLQFCIGGSKLTDHNMNTTPRGAQNGISPVTPKLNLTCPNSQFPVFKFLQLKGCEVLAHFLGSRPQDVELPNYQFSMDALRCEVISGPTMFVKNASLLISAARELFISLGKDVPESLIFHIWYSLVAHMKNAIEGVAKLDMRETVTMFLKQFQIIILSRVLSNNAVMKMFEGICCLPEKVLCSSAYNIGGGEMINGTPALFLMEMLLTPALLQTSPQLEKYHTLYSRIISSGLHNSTGSLGFLQGILQLLDQNAGFVENSETLWRFWSAVVQPLQEHIIKTNEINQGDSLEHNFSCVYQALLFPLKHKLPMSVPQQTMKTLTKTWTELYKTVNRLAAMVTNAEANIVCEDICQEILDLNKELDDLEPSMLEFEINASHVIISSLDFSSLGGQSTFGLGAASPAKKLKKRHKVLGNIHSLVFLLNNLQNRLTKLIADTESEAKSFLKSSVDKVPLQGMLNTMVDNFSSLFTHVTSSSSITAMIGCLAQPMGELYQDVAKRTAVKVYNNAFQQKMEKLWMDIATCLQSRYQSVFDSEFLHKLSPLFEATFLHSRRQIKNQTLSLWNVTFGKAAKLDYPDALKPVLHKVKEKSTINLPGWVSTSIPVIEETPISQMSQSQAPEPHIPGMPSPHKLHGSFLNKAVSPNVKRSPAKTVPSPKANSARKKVLGFDSLDEKDFVVIRSSPRKPKVLTDHQKEVMKERKILPAMYNNLELSQDVSMMAHFSTDTQDGSQSQTPTPTLDKPFSLFGSGIPPSIPTDKQKSDAEKMKSPEPNDKGVKKTGFKSPGMATKTSPVTKTSPSTSNSEPTPSRRRSVRFKDDEKKQDLSKADDSDLMSVKGKKAPETNNKRTKVVDTVTEESSEEVIISKESEGQIKAVTDKALCHKPSPEKEMALMQPEVMLEKCDSQVTPDKTSVADNFKSDAQNDLDNRNNSSSECDKGFSMSNRSIPQNVLGALGPTPESSSKSSESKSQGVMTTDDGKSRVEKDDDDSQPLFSWTQKLNQLNKSPRSQSPLRKIMSSPDRKGSPVRTRSQSPGKSPRRAKKKLVDENYGNLDKWIIRSPGKNVTIDETDNIMTVGSATIVEETQSPTKFSQSRLDENDKNDSIMETPPKNDFINSGVGSFGNSNRKLFQSSQENIENMNIVEDSNIIAASPNAKSYKPGTPILKLTRLTDSEIKKYSPAKDGKRELEFTPTKSGKKKTVTIKFDVGGKDIINQSPNSKHRHDDFIGFKPIESDSQSKTDNNEYFSKSLTDTDRAMMNMNADGQSADSDSERMEVSQSDSELCTPSQNEEIQGLFSQIVKEAKLEAEMHANEIPFEQSADIFTQELQPKTHLDIENSQSSQVEAHSQDGTLDSQQSQNETQSQDETQDSQHSDYDTQDSQEKVVKTPKRGRKRKQETSKKTTPDEVKRGRNKKSEENSLDSLISNIGSAQKVSRRLREKREKLENKLSKISSPPDSKTSSDKELETKDKKELSSQEENIESKKIRKSKNASEDNVKEKPVTESSEQEVSNVTKEQDVKHDECGNIFESLNEEKIADDIGKADTDEGVCAEEKKHEDKSVTEESELSENDKRLESTKKKGSKKDVRPLKKKISSSQEEKLQKTPESRNSSVQPERKSTTKKRKEVAQKKVSNRGKDVVVNDSDSNLDQDLSDEDLPLSVHVSKKAIAENLEKKIDKQLGTESKLSDKCEAMEIDKESTETSDENLKDNLNGGSENNEAEDESDSEAMDVSFCSDDIPLSKLKSSQDEKTDNGIPLSTLKSSQEEPKEIEADMVENESGSDKEKSEKVKGAAKKVTRKQKQNTSPITNKLRSVKTRLRSGEKKSVNVQGKNKLSLTSKHVNSAKKKLNVESKKKGETRLDVEEIEKDANEKNETEINETDTNINTDIEEKSDNTAVSKEISKKDLPEAEKNVASESDKGLTIGPPSEGFAGMKDESTSTASVSRPTNPVYSILDETPTKVIESPKRLPASMLIRNSDSKLILGSRKFDRRSSLARRSILKPSSVGSPRDVNSPKRDFHPIKVARIYSPTASPSASILKKRRLSDDPASDTNSPPAKQRRVSFATPLTEMQAHAETEIPPSEFAASQAVDKSNIPTTQKPDTPALAQVPTEVSGTQASSSTPISSTYQSTQATPTPNTYQSSQETQLDDSQAVYPELIDCGVAVEKILPQLTSSVWSRGLGQLVRARNIHTIGDLSALTEAQIDNLPIKAPKVLTVKKVLGNFSETQLAKKSKLGKSPKAPKVVLMEEDPIPVRDTAKTTDTQEETADQLSTDIDKLLASSGNLVDEVSRLSQKIDQSAEEEESCDNIKDQSGTTQQTCDLQCAQSNFRENKDNLTEEMGESMTNSAPFLKNFSDYISNLNLENMKTKELCQLQQEATNFQNKLTSVFMARCASPPP